MSPFRLTPQILGLMRPFRSHGLFNETMTELLRQIRDNEDVLLSILSIFIKEPTIDWIKESDKKKMDMKELADQRISTVKRKLSGENPAVLSWQSLKKMYPGNEIIKKSYEKLLAKHANQDDTVQALIGIATDKEIFARSYAGWSPHL